MASQILIKDLKFYGFHGVYPEEQVVGTTFRLDITADMDADLAGFHTDKLEDTLNYELIVEHALRIGTTQKFKLIERLAQVLAEEILHLFAEISRVEITVYKSVTHLTPEPQWIGIKRELCRTR